MPAPSTYRPPHATWAQVDVEGAELGVLHGMDAAAWAATRSLCLEVHDVDGRPEAVLCMLQQHGYTAELEASSCVPGCTMVYAWRDQGSPC